jgi:uncharacterized protein YjiS (DUF1127 family)
MNPLLDTFSASAITRASARETQIARQVAYLNSFDDRLLADIGLERSDIEAYVRSRFGQKGCRIGVGAPSHAQDTSLLHGPVVEVALGGVANLALVALFAFYPARWLGLW